MKVEKFYSVSFATIFFNVNMLCYILQERWYSVDW